MSLRPVSRRIPGLTFEMEALQQERRRKPAPQPAKPLSEGAQKWAERIAAKRLLREPLIGGAAAGTTAAAATYALCQLIG